MTTLPRELALVWPATLTADTANRIVVRFRDFPEAVTDGDDEADALAQAADCLAEAVAGRIARRDDIPPPSPIGRETAVPLEALLAYKAALYGVMRADGLSNVDLARRLGVDEKEVRRMTDPRYRGTKISRLTEALAECGVTTAVVTMDSARRKRILKRPGQAGHGESQPRRAVTTRSPA